MKVEVWTDVICPWCYIGRKRFDKALTQFVHRETVEVVFRSFELDPDAPVQSDMTLEEKLATKYGLSRTEARAANERVTKIAAEEGLPFRLDLARPTNTLAAHRVLNSPPLGISGRRSRSGFRRPTSRRERRLPTPNPCSAWPSRRD